MDYSANTLKVGVCEIILAGVASQMSAYLVVLITLLWAVFCVFVLVIRL